MRTILIIAALVVLVVGAWSAVTFRAPAITADIDARATAAVAPATTHPVDVVTEGRHIRLTGTADTAEERLDLLARAARTHGRVSVQDELAVLDRADPFSFTASLDAAGAFSLTGVIPSIDVQTRLEQAAKRLSGGRSVRGNLALASGVPEGDWASMVEETMRILLPLKQGIATVDGLQVHIAGEVLGLERRDAVLAEIAAAPFGDWSSEIKVILPTVTPYTFDADNKAGAFTFVGHAPDQTVEARLRERAVALATARAEGSIRLAQGMPSDDWPLMVEQALGTLSLLATGSLSIQDTDVMLTGEVETDLDLERVKATMGPGWSAEISVRQPDPAPRLTLTAGADGLVASGVLPRRSDATRLSDIFPDADQSAVALTGSGDPAAWDTALSGLAVVMTRVQTGEAAIAEGTVTLIGVLKEGFTVAEAAASLRIALGDGWLANVSLRDAATLTQSRVIKDGSEARLTGVLPASLPVDEALDALGILDDPEDGTLEASGVGDAEIWQRGLRGLRAVLVAYDSAEAVITEGDIRIEGALAPGHTTADLQDWAETLLAPGWQVTLAGEETAVEDGARRLNLATGEEEVRRRGFWLPALDFAPSPDACSEAARTALEAEKITFVTGSAEIDARARVLLNRLSAVAIRCVNDGATRLQIAGHTDDVGEEAANQTLSQARADAVFAALDARGVETGAMTATGLGETAPIAPNDTDEGRASNRRIEFTFTE